MTDHRGFIPVARVKTDEGGASHWMVEGRFGGRTIRVPMELFNHPPYSRNGLGDYLAKYCGSAPIERRDMDTLRELISGLPVIEGTTRLGWTTGFDAFLYGRDVFYTAKQPAQRYEFLGDPLPANGSWEEQFHWLWVLWHKSQVARLCLAVATVSPFLEPLRAPSLCLHLVGPTGIGKTTLLRVAGIAPFADPRSPLLVADVSHDTANYLDTQLGRAHNFPVLLDETTLRAPEVMEDVVYKIHSGRTKGRLTGPEQGYAPAPTASYCLVCFLSGEDSIRHGFERRGAAARLLEVRVDAPLLPKDELSGWRGVADEHHGWYGRLLVRWVIAMYFTLGRDGEPLRNRYAEARERVACWGDGHSRVHDFLAAVLVGYWLSYQVLHIALVGAVTREKRERIAKEAEAFTHEVYRWLDPRTRIDDVLDAIVRVDGMAEWIQCGRIPTRLLDGVATEFGYDKPRGAFLKLLVHHGIVSKAEPRKVEDGGGDRRSERCYILTPAGQEELRKRSQTTE